MGILPCPSLAIYQLFCGHMRQKNSKIKDQISQRAFPLSPGLQTNPRLRVSSKRTKTHSVCVVLIHLKKLLGVHFWDVCSHHKKWRKRNQCSASENVTFPEILSQSHTTLTPSGTGVIRAPGGPGAARTGCPLFAKVSNSTSSGKQPKTHSKQLTFPALLWSHSVLWCPMSSFSIHFHPLQEASYNADRIRHTTATGQREQNIKTLDGLNRHMCTQINKHSIWMTVINDFIMVSFSPPSDADASLRYTTGERAGDLSWNITTQLFQHCSMFLAEIIWAASNTLPLRQLNRS